jgi:carbonic anhydrase
MRVHDKDSQATMTPEQALTILKEGNGRFRQNLRVSRDLLQQVNATSDGQWPFATILSCIDSRTSAELIFDQGLGDVFSIRIAGNIINDDILGSMEFATKVAGSKLLVVLGHTNCGAIKGACDMVQLGNLSTLLNKIQPSVYLERKTKTDRNAKNEQFVERVARIQVRRSVESIIEHSVIVRELIETRAVGLIGAHYDIDTGEVEFFDDTYMCGTIKHFYLDLPEGAPSPA